MLCVSVGKTPTRWTPGPWGCWWKWQSCTGSTLVVNFYLAPMVCCTLSWEMAWSPWTTWRRWTGSGEIRSLSIVRFYLTPSLAPTIVKVYFVCVLECSDFTGSVLRVDVDTDCCTSPYSIPQNNPYFNSTNQPPEIFAHGLHDPGRWVEH